VDLIVIVPLVQGSLHRRDPDLDKDRVEKEHNIPTEVEGEAGAMVAEEGEGERVEEGVGHMRLHRRTFRINRMPSIMFRRTLKEQRTFRPAVPILFKTRSAVRTSTTVTATRRAAITTEWM
jgi:hypothetical protein